MLAPFAPPGEVTTFWVRLSLALRDLMRVRVVPIGLLSFSSGSVDGGLLVRVETPAGSTLLPAQHPGVARLLLPSGDVVVARERERDPDGPWALSVELVEEAEHRMRLAWLHERDRIEETEAWHWSLATVAKGWADPFRSEEDDWERDAAEIAAMPMDAIEAELRADGVDVDAFLRSVERRVDEMRRTGW